MASFSGASQLSRSVPPADGNLESSNLLLRPFLSSLASSGIDRVTGTQHPHSCTTKTAPIRAVTADSERPRDFKLRKALDSNSLNSRVVPATSVGGRCPTFPLGDRCCHDLGVLPAYNAAMRCGSGRPRGKRGLTNGSSRIGNICKDSRKAKYLCGEVRWIDECRILPSTNSRGPLSAIYGKSNEQTTAAQPTTFAILNRTPLLSKPGERSLFGNALRSDSKCHNGCVARHA